jgi:hypothetical protein
MSQDYQDMGLDEFGTRAVPISDKPKTVISALEADSMFGDGSFPGGKLTSGPNLSTFGFPDNFDSTHPFNLPYYIDYSAMVTRATISLYFQKYRAYETGASSGGSSTATSGASSTSSSASESSHTHSITGQATEDEGTGMTSHQHGSLGKRRTTGWVDQEDSEVKVRSLGEYDPLGYEKYQLVLANKPDTNIWDLVSGYTLTAHKHNITGQATASGVSHSHNIPHTHNVDVPAHTHGITYAIYEGAYPTAVSITIDGVDVTTVLGGPWNPDAVTNSYLDIDITKYTASSGTHIIQLTTTGQGRCIPLLIIKSVLGSKS